MDAALFELADEFDQLTNRTAEAIKLPDHQGVARAKVRPRFLKSRAIATSATATLLEAAFASRSLESLKLKVEGAAILGRH